MSRVIVVGGGAAGMIAAISAADKGHRVCLLEQNEKLGKKIYITGKGRCNVTNACETETLFENVVTNPKFLYSSFYEFDNKQMMNFLEQQGCPLKTERGDRVFPVSDHASDIIAALERGLRKRNVEISLNTKVYRLVVEADCVTGVEVGGAKKTDTDRERKVLKADAVIVATGGLSYPTTGSTGSGYHMAESVGHTIKECVPALVPMEIEEDWCRELQGLSLKNVSLTMFCKNKKIYSGFGEMLFTHFGVSGPLVLSASSFYHKCKDKDDVQLVIDLKPALNHEQLDKRIIRDFEENNNKQYKNALNGLFPTKMIPIMIRLSEIHPDQRVNEISREQRQKLLQVTKALTMRVTGVRDFKEAIITQGGIKVKEINPSTMESKLVKGLYFAGEVLDLDALTGGFNLQIAWSTGHLAGNSIV